MSEAKTRRTDLDILKGLCILTVVCYHASVNYFWFSFSCLYGFFFAAGYTFKDKPFKTFALSKIKSLYVPFILSSSLVILLLKVLGHLTGGYYSSNWTIDSVKDIFLFRIPHTMLSPAWFVFPLFALLFVYYFLNKIIKNDYILLAVCLVIYIAGAASREILNTVMWNNCAWLTNVCYGVFIFALGDFMKKHQDTEKYLFEGRYSRDLFVAIVVILCILDRNPCGFELDMRVGHMENFWVNTVYMILGTYFGFYISKMISGSALLANPIAVLGRRSMPIMYFHPISYAVVTLVTHYLFGYEWPDTWIKAYLYSGGFLRFMNVVAGILIPVCAAIVWDKIKQKVFVRKEE